MPDYPKLLVPSLVLWFGAACWQAGMVRSKNVASLMLTSLTLLCVGVLSFHGVGAAFCPNEAERFIGVPVLYGGDAGHGWLTYVPLLMLPLAGATAERTRFFAVLLPAFLLAGIAGPIVLVSLAHAPSSWQPFRRETVFFFGAILLGASASLTLAALVGPRQGKFNRDGSTTFFPGHSVPLHVLGAVLIAFSLGLLTEGAAISSAAAGLIGGLALGQLRFGKPDPICILTGLVAGAIAGGALLVDSPPPPWLFLATGGAVGFLAPWAALQIELRGRIDDPSMLAKPLAVTVAVPMVVGGLVVPGTPADVARHAVGALLVVVLLAVAGAMTATLGWLVLRVLGVRMRVREADEYDGLDLAVHDINAYPDFQQTMIKSHHMRQA